MIPCLRHYCSLGYKFYFLFWKVQTAFKVPFYLCFITTKTQDKMPQKSKMELIDLIEQKQLVRIAHELLNFI